MDEDGSIKFISLSETKKNSNMLTNIKGTFIKIA